MLRIHRTFQAGATSDPSCGNTWDTSSGGNTRDYSFVRHQYMEVFLHAASIDGIIPSCGNTSEKAEKKAGPANSQHLPYL